MAQAFGGQGSFSGVDIIVLSFLVSVLIAIVAVIAGVGGGVIFTPLLLAFTSFDTLLIRSTGLVVAMFSGLISSGPLMRKGLADIKIVLLGALPIIIGGMSGSFTAIYLARRLGEQSDGIIRLLLGLMLLSIAAVFISKSSSSDYPTLKKSESFSQFLKLRKTYWESSLGSYVSYRATNVKISIFLFLVIGFTGGFFGLGGGWAAVPLLNLVMSIPNQSGNRDERSATRFGKCGCNLALHQRRCPYRDDCCTMDARSSYRGADWSKPSDIFEGVSCKSPSDYNSVCLKP
jgi:uncharacterized membrane protein YfcA